MQAVAEADWLRIDAAYAGQLAAKAQVLRAHRDRALRMLPEGEAAADELLGTVLDWLAARADVVREAGTVRRPDGAIVPIDRRDPLGTLGRLVQEDLCLLDKRGDEHVLVAALLGFPSGWTLAEKIGRPLSRIHAPVPPYDAAVAARVQRMFDRLPPGRIMGRANLHPSAVADLWLPRAEGEPKPNHAAEGAPYWRSEWQTVRRLPRTGAIVFTIHVSVVPA